MLQALGENIWLADGPVATVAGFRYPTRMAVIRLGNGGLFAWSPVALTPALKAAIDALGPVRHIIAPNTLHDLHLAEWRRAYPQAQLHAPGVFKRRAEFAVTGTLSDTPDPAWAAEMDQVLVPGNAITTEIVFFHRASGTAIFTDLIQHFKPGWFSGWRAMIARMDRMVAPEPSVPRKFRVAFMGHRKAAREAIARVLAWPAHKVVMAHGAPVTEGGQAFLARAFQWLTG